MATIAEEYVSIFSADMSPLERGIAEGNSALKSLEAQIGQNNSALRSFDGEIATARGQMAELVGKMTDLRQAGKSNTDQFRDLQTQFQQLTAATRGLSAAKGQLTVDAKNLRDAESQAVAKVKELEAALKSQQQAAAASAQTFQKISAGIQDVAAGMARAGGLISGFVTAPIAAISEMGRSFETELRRVAANTAMTDAELNVMRQTVMDLGRNSAAPLADIAHGFEHAANFGFNAAESAKILDVAMQGAVATGAKTEAVTNTLAGVMHQFGLSADQASVTLNTLKEAAGKGNLTLEEMVNVSGRVFSTAANLGLSLNEAAGAMSALTRAGFPASQASTQLVGALTHLVNPSKEVRGELERLSKTTGVDLVRDFSQFGLQSKGLSGILQDVKKAVGDNTAEALKLFGGIRGGLGAMALMNNASEDYKNILVQLADTMGGKLTPIQDAYAREVNTLGFQIGELKNRLTLLGDALNNAFSGGQVNFVKQLNEAVDALTRGFQSLDPAMQAAVITFVGAFALGGPILLGVGAVVTLIGGPLTLAIVGVTAALAVLAADFSDTFSKAGQSSSSFKDSLIDLVGVLGSVMDVLGVIANAVVILEHNIVAGAKEAFYILTGDWKKAMDVSAENTQIVGKAWTNLTAELEGKWGSTLQNMVRQGFDASAAFAAAGRANASAYSQSFASIGIGRGGTSPFASTSPVGPAPNKPVTSMWLPGSPEAIAAESAAAAAGQRTAAAYAGGIGSGLKKHGAGISQALVDLFQGSGGFDRALSLIQANVSKLGSLLDPTTKQFRLQGQQIEKALNESAKNINEFLGAAGIKSKVTATDIINNFQGMQDTLGKTGAFEHIKDALNSINIQRVSAGLQDFDASLKVNKDQLILSADALQALQEQFPQLEAQAKSAGLVLTTELPKGISTAKLVAQALEYLSTQNKQFLTDIAFDTRTNLIKARIAWDELVKGLPVEVLKQKLKDLKEALAIDPDLSFAKAQLEIRGDVESAIDTFEKYGETLGKTGEELKAWAIEQVRNMGVFKEGNQTALNDVIEKHKLAAIQLPGIWGPVFDKLGSQAKSWAGAIFGVLDTIPGKFGSTVKKVTDTINQWVGFFDKILGLLHKFSSDVPDSLGSMVSKILGIFKGGQSSILDSSGFIIKNIQSTFSDATGAIGESLGHSIGGAAASVEGLAKSAGTGIGQSVTSGLSSFLSSGIGIAGAVIGALSLFVKTFQSDSKAIRFAGGFAIGGLIGGFLSLFKGGPSELQKAQMAAELQKARDAIKLSEQTVLQAIETTKQSMLTTLGSALDLAPMFEEFQGVSKRQIQSVFKFMTRLVNQFLEAAKQWVGVNIEQTKQIAEMVGSVFGALASLPAAANAINSTFEVSDTQIDMVFGVLNRIIERWSILAEQWIGGASKRIKKVADRIAPALNLIGPLVQVIKDATDLKDPGDESFNVIGRTLDKIINMVGDLAGKYEKPLLKALQNLGEKVGPALDLWKSDIEAIKASVDLPKLKESDADNAVQGMRLFIDKLIANFTDFDTTGLGRIIAIVAAVSPVADALKAWAEGSAAVKDYVKIAATTWDDIATDFQRAKDLVLFMLASAVDFLPQTLQFKDVMAQIAANLKAGLDSLGSGLSAAASAFGSVVNAIQGGVPVGSNPAGGGSLGGESSAGGSSFGALSLVGSSGVAASNRATASTAPIIVNVNVNGNLIHQSRITDEVVRAIVEAQRTGRLRTVAA